MGKSTEGIKQENYEKLPENAENAEKLLELTSDTMILLDRNGICVDIAVHNADLWFLKENQLLDRNILQLLPSVTYRQVYPEFKKVLAYKEVSARNYELTIGSETYFFKCIMRPYEDMVLCQYRDITERSQRKREMGTRKYGETTEMQKAIGDWLCGYTEHRQPFDEIKHRHTLKEVGDVAEGAYDWKIERMQENGIKM